jgi:septation ring formation regulator EzrA
MAIKSFCGLVLKKDHDKEVQDMKDFFKRMGGLSYAIEDLSTEIIDSLQKEVDNIRVLLNIYDFLLGKGEDVRFEEVILCLTEQVQDNPQWVVDFSEQEYNGEDLE